MRGKKVQVLRLGNSVLIQGDRQHFARLAWDVLRLAEDDPYYGPDSHIEHYDSHPFLAQDSIPLVLLNVDKVAPGG